MFQKRCHGAWRVSGWARERFQMVGVDRGGADLGLLLQTRTCTGTLVLPARVSSGGGCGRSTRIGRERDNSRIS